VFPLEVGFEIGSRHARWPVRGGDGSCRQMGVRWGPIIGQAGGGDGDLPRNGIAFRAFGSGGRTPLSGVMYCRTAALPRRFMLNRKDGTP
jgi:hypothetical protein